jgi:predicted NBD/HSP70 family sugar kinase
MQKLLAQRLNSPVEVVNDAQAQSLGALGDHGDSLAYVSIGTGVGGALISEGRQVRGHGLAAEFAHIQVPEAGRYGAAKCHCGRPACLEQVVSGSALDARLGPDWWRRDYGNELDFVYDALASAVDQIGVVADPARIVISSRALAPFNLERSIQDRMRGPIAARTLLAVDADPTELAFAGLRSDRRHSVWGPTKRTLRRASTQPLTNRTSEGA